MAPCVKPAIRAISTCRCSWREPNNLLQYFTWSIAWHCQNFAKSRSEGHFNRWGSSESSNTRPFSIPTLTSSESVHLKLHEMYLQSNSSLLFITHVIYGWMYSKLDQVVLRNSPVMWCLTSAPDCNDVDTAWAEVYFSMRGGFSRGGVTGKFNKMFSVFWWTSGKYSRYLHYSSQPEQSIEFATASNQPSSLSW